MVSVASAGSSRAMLERTDHDLELVAINDLADASANALLFKRDSVHGKWPGDVSAEGDVMIVDGKRIKVTCERDPANLPHKELGVDIALECRLLLTRLAGKSIWRRGRSAC